MSTPASALCDGEPVTWLWLLPVLGVVCVAILRLAGANRDTVSAQWVRDHRYDRSGY